MNLGERLRSVTRLFLDTAPVIYFIEENPRYLARVRPVFDRIDSGVLTAVTSPITLGECLVHPYRLQQPGCVGFSGADCVRRQRALLRHR